MILAVSIESGNLILLAIAAVITAATPGFLAWLQGRKIHTIVNSQRTEMQESIRKLEAESKVSAAAAAEAVAERRMAEMNAANQAALREAIIEASKINADARGLAAAPVAPVAVAAVVPPVAGDGKTIVAEKIIAEKIVTSDDIDAEHPLIKQLREALQPNKGKEKKL